MISIIITLVILGVCLWLLERFVPMDEAVRTIIRVVVVLFLIVFLLNAFGIVNIPLNVR